ncbi:MAG: sensor domain-containing diguanylate cyclase [Candidatus Omnitrophica bacterium]|nr:sensor domain-containing diguanylate cyclase [Candidatus Omnitrophota bacterium]
MVLGYAPLLKLDLFLPEQILSSYLFVSNLILILAWALSGPVVAGVLTALVSLVALYLSLSLKAPEIFFQTFVYAAIFVWMIFYLHETQKKTNHKRIAGGKIAEDLNLLGEELRKKDELKKALGHKIERLLELQKFSEELKDAKGVPAAAADIVREVRRVLDRADECALYLVDESREGLALAAAESRQKEAVREKTGGVFDRWVMKRCHSIAVDDARSDFRFPAEADRLRSVCASPLVTENKVLGVIRAGAYAPHAFTSDDLRFLDILSGLGAVTLRNLLLLEKMEELAIRDGLTGLFLNRYFQERLAGEIQRAHHSGSVFSLLLLDIDFFKNYNDEYGHSAGDLVLKSVAGLVAKCLEHGDLAARYGGEEFVVLLPGRSKSQALEAAETIRREVEQNRFFLRRVEGRVTVSVGAAAFPGDGRTPEELMETVDKRLYEAKHAGRNRVCGGI